MLFKVLICIPALTLLHVGPESYVVLARKYLKAHETAKEEAVATIFETGGGADREASADASTAAAPGTVADREGTSTAADEEEVHESFAHPTVDDEVIRKLFLYKKAGPILRWRHVMLFMTMVNSKARFHIGEDLKREKYDENAKGEIRPDTDDLNKAIGDVFKESVASDDLAAKDWAVPHTLPRIFDMLRVMEDVFKFNDDRLFPDKGLVNAIVYSRYVNYRGTLVTNRVLL